MKGVCEGSYGSSVSTVNFRHEELLIASISAVWPTHIRILHGLNYRDNLLHLKTSVKNSWSSPSISPCLVMAWRVNHFRKSFVL